MDLKKYIEDRPAVADKWAEIKDQMSTHLMGKPPEWLFRSRRPLESSNEYALTYRLENFEPVTKQSFKLAVDSIIETATHVYSDIKNVDSNTADFIDEHRLKVAGKTYTIEDYIIRYVGRMVEADANAVLVVYPKHPTEELIPDFREDLPNFNNIQNQFVDLEIELISSDHVQKIDEDKIIFYGGEWVYDYDSTAKKEKTKPFYYMLTKEQTSLIIPYKKPNNQYDYKIEEYYFNDLTEKPFDVIGNNAVLDEIDDEVVEYFESTYAGAVAIGNDVLGVKSDEQICTTRFTYPEKYQSMERCGHPGCIECRDPKSPYAGLYVQYDETGDCSTCSTCSGTGKVAPDTSPLGTHFVAKSDIIGDDGKFQPLTAFVTPPLESPRYLSEEWRRSFQQMEAALFIISQNMTNQSGVSKSFDIRQKVTTISNAVMNIFNIYERLLNTIQGYLKGEQNVMIQLPPDFNIKSSHDITVELSEAKDTSSIYTSELTKELLLKKFGNTDKTRKMVGFLELHDKLFGMTIDEIIKLKAIYGNALTPRDQVIHDKGLAVLNSIEDIMEKSDEQLKVEFDAVIDTLAPVVNPSPIA